MICVDIDNAKFVDALRVAYNMRYMFNSRVWIDKTHKGYHVCSDINLAPTDSIKAREILGDDPWRISISRRRLRMHGRYADITFRWKDGREVIRYVYVVQPEMGV